MINLSLPVAIFIYLGIVITVIFIMWSLSENRKRSKKFVEEKVYIWYCDICSSTYIDTMHVKLSRCPQCDSYIERKDIKDKATEKDKRG